MMDMRKLRKANPTRMKSSTRNGQAQPPLIREKTATHMLQISGQCRKRSFMPSYAFPQKTPAAHGESLFLSWFRVGAFPHHTSQVKDPTFFETHGFHIILTSTNYFLPPSSSSKLDLTVKLPFFVLFQGSLSQDWRLIFLGLTIQMSL